MPIVGSLCHFMVLYAYSQIVVSVRGSVCLLSERFVSSWLCMRKVRSLGQFVVRYAYSRIVVSLRCSVCLYSESCVTSCFLCL